jgi:hypothetical protein
MHDFSSGRAREETAALNASIYQLLPSLSLVSLEKKEDTEVLTEGNKIYKFLRNETAQLNASI